MTTSDSHITTTYGPSATNIQTGLPQDPSKRHSDGSLAGAIVGSAIGGALLAFLATYFFFGRRQSKREDDYKDKRTQGAPGKKIDGTETNGFRDNLDGALTFSSAQDKSTTFFADTLNIKDASLVNYIPIAADDQTVHNRVLTVFEQTALHVENYYSRDSSSNIESFLSTDDGALIVSYDSPFLPAPVTTLLSQSKAQVPVMKHCLMRAILSAILCATQSTSHAEEGLFLPPLYAVSKHLREMKLHPGNVYFYYIKKTAEAISDKWKRRYD